MSDNFDKEKIKYGGLVVLVGVNFSIWLQPFIHENQEAMNVIVTVFSILAGFLIAVITIVGDPGSLPAGTWRIAELTSELVDKRITRYKNLFLSYLVTLVLIFVSMLLKNKVEYIQLAIEYLYMFFACIATLLSFKLPNALMLLQKERIEQVIRERRKDAGIID